jgi:hypothetical protein
VVVAPTSGPPGKSVQILRAIASKGLNTIAAKFATETYMNGAIRQRAWELSNESEYDGRMGSKRARLELFSDRSNDLPALPMSRIQDRENITPAAAGFPVATNVLSASSNKGVGRACSMVRKIAGPVISTADRGRLTRQPHTSRHVVFPQRFSGDDMLNRGVHVKTSKT